VVQLFIDTSMNATYL